MASFKHCFIANSSTAFFSSQAEEGSLKPMLETLGERLREALEKSNKTQTQLAEYCEVSPQAVYGWVKNSRISKEKLYSASAFLGVSAEWLATGRGAMTAGTPLSVQEESVTYGSRSGLDRKLASAIEKNPKTEALLSAILDFSEASRAGRRMSAHEIATLVKALAQTIESAMAGIDPEERDPGVIAQAAVARYLALIEGESIEVEAQRVAAAVA